MDMVTVNPFQLFPRQVEVCELWKYAAPGKQATKICDVHAIIKTSTQSSGAADTVDSRISSRRFHLQTEDLPDEWRNPDALLDGILKRSDGRTYRITQATRGDDMGLGTTPFITAYGSPYARRTL